MQPLRTSEVFASPETACKEGIGPHLYHWESASFADTETNIHHESGEYSRTLGWEGKLETLACHEQIVFVLDFDHAAAFVVSLLVTSEYKDNHNPVTCFYPNGTSEHQ